MHNVRWHNHRGTELLHKRVEDRDPKPTFKGLRNRRHGLDCVRRTALSRVFYLQPENENHANPQNWLFLQYIRVVKLLQPEWVVFENVIGITQTAKGHFLASVRSALADAGCPLFDLR